MTNIIYCLDRTDVKVAGPPRTRKVFRKRLQELATAMGARHPAVLGDALLLLIEGLPRPLSHRNICCQTPWDGRF
ncbi:hypothetical protein [Bradyrhizobium septentrionale]|uniref:Uncharacterized protein n=1 Tax=Bradyrhizobium septentrionale TaxID=1404411 RepID=A0A973ZYE5_9BRAD|nr:hypothetical protein [Bradyrhizobium septentrionale]UGY20377.1 hypothetical protein HAP48_0024980 [Bradyrhizobium septentrionale]UGY29194.1 hypothetical protein HU675_0022185 [Bradyrhizobium septentrionale]